jgi:hypothetical protein
VADVAKRSWTLKSFLDSLTLELDRAQETLALKGLTRRLTYSVRDLALDLQLFPEFDGDELRFTTAQPGETGAARVSLQLGSITDRQIRESTREPRRRDDLAIEEVEELDPRVKTSLQKMGVTSVSDLERMEKSNVDLEKVANEKIDYGSLARLIQRSKRRKTAPQVNSASMHEDEDGRVVLTITGEHLAESQSQPEFPRAVLGDTVLAVRSAGPAAIAFDVDRAALPDRPTLLRIALDPHAVVSMNLVP